MVRNSSKSGWICFRMANNGWKCTSKWPKTVQMPENGFTLFKMVNFFFSRKIVESLEKKSLKEQYLIPYCYLWLVGRYI